MAPPPAAWRSLPPAQAEDLPDEPPAGAGSAPAYSVGEFLPDAAPAQGAPSYVAGDFLPDEPASRGAMARFGVGVGRGVISGTGETMKGAAEVGAALPTLQSSAITPYYDAYKNFDTMSDTDRMQVRHQVDTDPSLTMLDKAKLQRELTLRLHGVAPEPLDQWAPKPDATQSSLYKAGALVSDAADNMLPMTDAEKNTFSARFGQNVGGVVPALAAGAVGSLVGAPEIGLVAGAGQMGAMSAGQQAAEARAKGASPETVAKTALVAGATNTALGAADIGAIMSPIERAAPGVAPWVLAKLQQAARNGLIFTGIGEAQEWVSQEIAKNFYDPKAGYTPDVQRALTSLASGSLLGAIAPTPLAKQPDFSAMPPLRPGTEPGPETPPAAGAPPEAPPGLPGPAPAAGPSPEAAPPGAQPGPAAPPPRPKRPARPAAAQPTPASAADTEAAVAAGQPPAAPTPAPAVARPPETPVPPTVPEPAADIHAQIAALADPNNPKDAVFLAPGTPFPGGKLPAIDGLHIASRPEGTLLTTDVAKADLYRNAAAISDPLMAHLLGYPETKPEAIASGNPVVVQGTDASGATVAETLASPQGVPAAEAAIGAQTPKGGDVAVRAPQEVTDERAQETAAEGVQPGGAVGAPSAEESPSQPATPAAAPRLRTVEQIMREDGVGPKVAAATQAEEIASIGRPITMDEMAARRAGVAAMPRSEPSVPPLQPSDARPGAPYTMFTPAELTAEPGVMQFKTSDEKGVTGALTGFSTWEPGLANPITVWQTNDGRNVVVNGHQRLDLAQRAQAAGQQGVQLPARVYREADGYSPEYMRALGAYQNIAEGSGTPLDAARVLRTKNAFPDSMRLPELPPHQQIVQQARGLAQLSPDAFGAVENGLVPPEYAGMVGALISEPAEQMAALDALARGHPANPVEARFMISDIRNSGFLQGAQTTLFGEEAFARSLVPERAKVFGGAMKILRSAAAAFRATVKGEKTLTAAGNVLATGANVEGKTASERLIDTIQRNATTVGPYSDALNVAARELAAGKPLDKVAHAFLAAARELERGGTRAGVPAGDHGRGVGHEGEGESGPIAAEGQNGLLEAIGRLAQPPIKDERQRGMFFETPKTMPKVTGTLPPHAMIGSAAEDFTRFAQQNSDIPPSILAARYVLDRGRQTGHEYLTAYDPHAGAVVLAHTSGASSVVNFPPGFGDIAADPARALVFHHNHPKGMSLSSSDVHQLSLPGVSAVVAYGHDGSFYAASLGPAVDRSANTPVAIANGLAIGVARAKGTVTAGLLQAIKDGEATQKELEAVLWDTINRVLHSAGMIDYVAAAPRAPHVATIADRVAAAAIRGGRHVGDHRHPDAASADEGIARVLARSADDSRARRSAGQKRDSGGPGLSEGAPGDANGRAQEAGVRGLAEPRGISDPRWHELLRRGKQQDRQAAELAAAGKPVRGGPDKYGLSYLVSPDMHKPGSGEWRTTTFRDGVPQGHIEHRNALEAFTEALRYGHIEPIRPYFGRRPPLPPAGGAPLFGEPTKPTENLYRPLLRPAGFESLPRGVKWDFVEAPQMHGLANRPDLPQSQHRYGVIRTDRPLTAEETKHFDLEPVGGKRGPEPTVRTDERQAVMPGMGPSAVQAQAARDQAGRGGLLPTGEQRPANEGLFAPPKPDQKPLFGRHGQVPLYSAVERAVDGLKQAKGTGEQFAAQLAKVPGVKPEELKWLGLPEWLRQQKSVTRQQIADYVRANSLDVREVMRGDAWIAQEHAQRAIDEAAEDRRGGYQAIDEALHGMGDTVEVDGDRLYVDELARGLVRGNIKPEDLPAVLRAPSQQYVDAARRHEAAGDAYDREREDSLQNPRNPKFQNYQLPGGQNYRELLITMPPKPFEGRDAIDAEIRRLHVGRSASEIGVARNPADQPRLDALMAEWEKQQSREETQFRSGHWEEPNVLAHVRFSERRAPDGKRVLHIEELQSDWHQQGRKRGYASDIAADKAKLDMLNQEYERQRDIRTAANNADDLGSAERALARLLQITDEMNAIHDRATDNRLAGHGIPDAPFKATWPALLMKRMIKYAVDNGFDRVAWTPGDEQAKRYDLSKKVASITVYGRGDDLKLFADGHQGEKIANHVPVTRATLADHIGKDAADKLLAQPEPATASGWRKITGDDLKAGGAGQRAFYDKMLPIETQKIVGKFGAKVGKSEIGTGKPDRDTLHPDDEAAAKYKPEWDRVVAELNPLHSQNARRTLTADGERRMYELQDQLNDLNGKMVDETLARSENKQSVHSFDITPQLRLAVMEHGLPLFQRGAMAGHPDYPHPTAIQAVIDAARAITGGHIQIEAYDAEHHAFRVKFPDGHTEQVFGYAIGRLIRAAIEPGRFAQNMNHEALHALKRLGVFTKGEWSTLEQAAERGNWIDKHGVRDRYPELDHAGQIEEAIADEMGERAAAPPVGGATPSFIARMLAKARTFLARLRNMLRGHGFHTADDVFGKALSGEAGAREPGSGMEQIGPETVEGSREAARAWGLRDPNEGALGRGVVPITAYHGSPHDFDRFDASKIGTGEGAQAYGHGLYFAEREGVARDYRDKLAKRMTPASQSDYAAARERLRGIQNAIDALDQKMAQESMALGVKPHPDWGTIGMTHHEIVRERNRPEMQRLINDREATTREIAEILERPAPPGRMYKTALHLDPDKTLDWDKPLSQQPKGVQEALSPERLGLKPAGPFGENGYYGWVDENGKLIGTARTGRLPDTVFNPQELGMGILRGAGSWSDPAAVAQRLRSAGIEGIRYLDQGSRAMSALSPEGMAQYFRPGSIVAGYGGNDRVVRFHPGDTGRGGYGWSVDVQQVDREGNPVGPVRNHATEPLPREVARAEQRRGETFDRPKGTSNYVVFDDKLIDIEAKFGRRGIEPAFARGPVPAPTPATAPPITTPHTMVERLERIPRIGHALATVGQKFTNVGHTAQMIATPMAAESASHETRALAKDSANLKRWISWDYNQIINWGRKTFKSDRLTAMWDASDADSVAMQTNGKPLDPGHGGRADLSPVEQTAVKAWQTDADDALALARKVGITEAEGLPSYAPRMVVDMVEGVMHPFGQGGDNARAEVVRNMLTLPLATMRLREAIANRALINQIKVLGARTGQAVVMEGGTPQDFRTFGTNVRVTTPQMIHRKHMTRQETEEAANRKRSMMEGQEFKWFTIKSNPAFWTWKPKMNTDPAGNFGPMQDAEGNIIFERVPIYVRGDFEGPLKAIMHESASGIVGRGLDKVYNGYMDLKGRMMSSILYGSAHLGVIAGRAFPAAPNLIRIGYAGSIAKQDPATMRRLILGGMAPISSQMGFRDVAGMIQDPQLIPGRSWTSKLLAAVPGLFDPKAGEAVKRAIDNLGDVMHNRLLWDQVQNLQVGLALDFEQHMLDKGVPPEAATRAATNLANIYAGALPRESMSQAVRAITNVIWFSRQYRLGNVAAAKAAITGLPRDVYAQIKAKYGKDIADLTSKLTRNKALLVVIVDSVFMYFILNSLLQSGLNVLLGLGQKTPGGGVGQEQEALPKDASLWDRIGAEGQGYLRRLEDETKHLLSHPQAILNPFGVIQSLSSLYEHEPAKRNRLLYGFEPDGTGKYIRNPIGKVGEDITDYFTSFLETMKKMLSPAMQPVAETVSNDRGFGKQLYDPLADTPDEIAQWGWHIGQDVASSTMPWAQRMANAYEGRETPGQAVAEIIAGGLGTSMSRGYPGGPALGVIAAQQKEQRYRQDQAMPGIRDMIKRGDNEKAADAMTDLGIPAALQRYYFGQTVAPHASRDQMRRFMLQATPEERARAGVPQ